MSPRGRRIVFAKPVATIFAIKSLNISLICVTEAILDDA